MHNTKLTIPESLRQMGNKGSQKVTAITWVFLVLVCLLVGYGFLISFPSLTNCLLCDSMEKTFYSMDRQFEDFSEGVLTDIEALTELHHDQRRLLTANNYGCGMDGVCSDAYHEAENRLIALSEYLQDNGVAAGSAFLWEKGHASFNVAMFENRLADSENAYHQFILGKLYADGIYAKTDYAKSLIYFSRSFSADRQQLNITARTIADIFKEAGKNEMAAPWQSFYTSLYIGDVDSAKQVMTLQAHANRLRGQWERGEYNAMGDFLRKLAEEEFCCQTHAENAEPKHEKLASSS